MREWKSARCRRFPSDKLILYYFALLHARVKINKFENICKKILKKICNLKNTLFNPIMTHPEKRLRREQIASDIKSGMTISQVVIKYQVGFSVVRDSCREHGISIKRKANVEKEKE